jgi:shikimate kinase
MNNLTFIGMAGCGKSTLGRALSNKLGVAFTDTDALIEKKFDQSLEDLKSDKGYKFVRLAEEGVILNLSNDIEIISTGGSAVYSKKSMEYLSSFSKLIYISTPIEVIKERIGSGQKRGLAAPIGTSIESVYFERRPMYEKWAQVTLDGMLSIEELVDFIILEILHDKN